MRNFYSFGSGGLIGILGGLIGLGGAEFRLPLLNILFRFDIKSAVILNIVISLITVIFAFIFRIISDDIPYIIHHLMIVPTILTGSLLGAYFGASLLVSIEEGKLKKIVFFFLLILGVMLMFHSKMENGFKLDIDILYTTIIAMACGVFIGIVSSMLGVAGGELIIPTIIFLYGIDIKSAGTLSLLISIPTLLISIYRYSKKGELVRIGGEKTFMVCMAIGSILGVAMGAALLGIVNTSLLEIGLGILLIVSAFKILILRRKD